MMYSIKNSHQKLSIEKRGIAFLMIIALLALASSLEVDAAETASKKAKADPRIVLVREVAPRIGYRALPKEQLPVSASATVFPSKVFDQSIGSVISATASETDLMQRGSLGLLVSGTDGKSSLTVSSGLQKALGVGAHSSVGIGGSARRNAGGGAVAGRVMAVTGQIANIIPTAINQATKPVGPPGG
jgi:hypothetical protein